jgi:diguanylate cyclase
MASASVVFENSVATLKKTLPLMMKYNVPVLPENYALWFTYASNEVPTLNKELDSAIKLYKTCPLFRAEQLYNKYVKQEENEQTSSLQKSIESMVSALGDSIGFTRQNAQKFEQAIDLCHDELAGFDSKSMSSDDVADFVSNLVAKSLQMKDNAKSFDN